MWQNKEEYSKTTTKCVFEGFNSGTSLLLTPTVIALIALNNDPMWILIQLPNISISMIYPWLLRNDH